MCSFPRCSDAGGGALPLSACNTFRSDAFLLLVDNLGILIEGNLLPCSSHFPLGVLNSATNINFTLRKHQAFFWHHCTHQALFWRRCRGERSLLRGESLTLPILVCPPLWSPKRKIFIIIYIYIHIELR